MRKILLASAFFAPLFFGAAHAHAQAPVVGPCYNGVACDLGAITAPTMTLSGAGTALTVTNNASFAGGSVTIGPWAINATGTLNFGMAAGDPYVFNWNGGGAGLVLNGSSSTLTGRLNIDAPTSDNPVVFNVDNSSFTGTGIAFGLTNSQQQVMVTGNGLSGTYVGPPATSYNCGGESAFLNVCNNGDSLTGGSPYSINVLRYFGGTGTTGARTAANFALINSPSNPTSDTSSSFYQAINIDTDIGSTLGGTSSNYLGSPFAGGMYITLESGAQYIYGASLMEGDITIKSGASLHEVGGFSVVLLAANAVAGDYENYAFTIAAAGGATATLTCGYCFGTYDGYSAMASTATLLGVITHANGGTGGPAVANGIDWHTATFSGNAYNDGHVTLTGAGDSLLNSATALATTATTGFVHLPNSAGAPTGTPSTISGDACEINTSTETLNCYIGSSWYHIALTSGAG